MIVSYNAALTQLLIIYDIRNRLVWASRRGMLETRSDSAALYRKSTTILSQESDQLLYQEFLECEDQNLFLWVNGSGSSNPSRYSKNSADNS